MLRFKEFMTEARLERHEYIQKLVDRHGKGMSFDHDPQNRHLFNARQGNWDNETSRWKPETDQAKIHGYAVHHTIGDIHEHDPDKKRGTNTDWMINQYKKGHYRHEDLGRVQTQVERFTQLKHTLPGDQRDLNRYTLNPSNEPKKLSLHGVLRQKEEHDKLYPDGPHFSHPDAKEVPGSYDRSKLKVFELTTHAAARAYRNSCGHPDNSDGWCTGWKSPEHYDNYKNDGPIYGAESREKHVDGEHHEWVKYQLHFPSQQFMDKDDTSADPRQIVKRNPEFRKVHFDYRHKGKPDDDGGDQMSGRGSVMPFLNDIGRNNMIEHDIENGETDHLRSHMAYYPTYFKSSHIHQMIDHPEIKDSKQTMRTITKLPHLKQEHIDKVMGDIIKMHEEGKSNNTWGEGWKTPEAMSRAEPFVHITQNAEHLHWFHKNSQDADRSYGEKHVAGSRLYNSWGQIPEIPERERNKDGYQRMAVAHHVWSKEAERIPSNTSRERFTKYHKDMQAHYTKLYHESDS